MASTVEFVEYVCEQSSGAGEITYKKMFGEYGVYCNGKIILKKLMRNCQCQDLKRKKCDENGS